MLDFTLSTIRGIFRLSAIAWASMVFPVPGSPFNSNGISKTMEMFTIFASSSSYYLNKAGKLGGQKAWKLIRFGAFKHSSFPAFQPMFFPLSVAKFPVSILAL
jgi:hypothetical protein